MAANKFMTSMQNNPGALSQLGALGGIQQPTQAIPQQQIPAAFAGENLAGLAGAFGQQPSQQQLQTPFQFDRSLGLGTADSFSSEPNQAQINYQNQILQRAQQQAQQPYTMPSYSVLDPNQYKAYDPSLGMTQKGASDWKWREYDDQIGMFAALGAKTADGQLFKPPQQVGYQNMMNSPLYQDLQGLNAGQKNMGIKAQQANALMADRLHEYGIDDLEDIGYTNDPTTGKQVFYNRATGQRIPGQITGTNKGEGQQKIQLTIGPDGRVIPRNVWGDTSDAKTIAPIVGLAALALPMLAPALLPALGGALGASAAWAPVVGGAAWGAGSGALQSGIQGGNVLKGALVGGATGAIAQGIGGGKGALWSSGSKLGDAAIRGGLGGALSTAAYGGNALKGGALGALASMGGQLGGEALGGFKVGDFDVSGAMGQQAGSTLARTLGSKLVGNPYEQQIQEQMEKAQKQGRLQAQQAQQAAAARRRQFNLTGFDMSRRERIKQGIDKGWGFANPGKEKDYEFVG